MSYPRLLFVTVLVVLALAATAGTSGGIADDWEPVRVDVDLSVENRTVEPGEEIVATVMIRNLANETADFDVDLHADGTSFGETTVTLAPDEQTSVELTAVFESEGAYNLGTSVEGDGPGLVSLDVVTLVVGNPAVEEIRLRVPDQHVTDERLSLDVLARYDIGKTRVLENTTVTVDGDRAAIEQGMLEPGALPDHSGTVSFEAAFGGATTNESVFVIHPRDVEVVPDPVYVGDNATLETIVILEDDRREALPDVTYYDPLDHQASVEDDQFHPTKAGKATVRVRLGATTILDHELTIHEPPADLDIQIRDNPLAIGERTVHSIIATHPNGTTEEVTLRADIRIENRTILDVDTGQLLGLATGETDVIASFGALETATTVAVEPADEIPGLPVSTVALALGAGLLAARRWT